MLIVSSRHRLQNAATVLLSFSITMCVIVAYNNNQIVWNVKRVGLAASRGERVVCETNSKQPHAVWVLPRLNDIFSSRAQLLHECGRLKNFPTFLSNEKTEKTTLIQALAFAAKAQKPFVTFFYVQTRLKPLNRRLLPDNGKITVEMTEASFYDVRKVPHSKAIQLSVSLLRCQLIRFQWGHFNCSSKKLSWTTFDSLKVADQATCGVNNLGEAGEEEWVGDRAICLAFLRPHV